MTGYTISVGYNSGFGNDAEVGEALLEELAKIQKSPHVIVDEITRVETQHGVYNRELLSEFAGSYEEPIKDLTLTISKDEEGLPIIRQSASGGSPAREIKEACRRAVCRLLLEAMHKRGMEINIQVS